PQQDRREVPAFDAAAQWAALADEMLLADELGQVARAHPRRKRLTLGRWLEEGLRPGASGPGSGCGWHRGQSRARCRSVGLPQLDLVAFGVEDSGEPSDPRRIPFGVRDD